MIQQKVLLAQLEMFVVLRKHIGLIDKSTAFNTGSMLRIFLRRNRSLCLHNTNQFLQE